METATMGRVTVKARIANLADLYAVQSGRLEPEEARSIEVDDALEIAEQTEV